MESSKASCLHDGYHSTMKTEFYYIVNIFSQAYGSQLVRKVQYRHVLARSYFSRIPDMAEQMKDKIQELPLPKPKEREVIARVRTDTQVQSGGHLDKPQQLIIILESKTIFMISH